MCKFLTDFALLSVCVQYNIIPVFVNLSLSFSVAALLSFLDSVYASLLVDLGSTFNKTLSTGMVRVFGIVGYLNDHDGPCGWRKLTFTVIAIFIHLDNTRYPPFFLIMHTTKPLISLLVPAHFQEPGRSSLEKVDSN